MKKQKSISVNAGLNMIRTVCQMLFPLITFPYVSRVLHVENIGIYNFCQSVISYFSLVAGLGISTYAIREGARYRDNEVKMSLFASEVFSINFISTVFSYLLLGVCILLIPKFNQYGSIIAVLSVSIVFTLVGSEWIFQIYEDYKYITLRSIAFQCVSLVLMFVFVKNSSDLFAYVLITAISCSGANILNAISRRKYCKIRLVINKNILNHLLPILVLFATTVATTIYTNADTTMLGFFSGNKAVGLYSVSTKIYNIVKQMLAAVIIVSIPRLSAYLGKKKTEDFNRTANQILNALIVIVIPAMVGLTALSRNTVFIIAGQEYVDANISLKILSVALLFSIFSWFYTSCVLIPYRCENKVLMATIVAALANIGLNFILIPIFKQDAAAFTTLIAEALSMTITWWYGRKYFKVSFLKKDIMSVIIGCIAICIICTVSEKYISSILISTAFSIIVSVLIYMIVLLTMKNQAVKMVLEIIHLKK